MLSRSMREVELSEEPERAVTSGGGGMTTSAGQRIRDQEERVRDPAEEFSERSTILSTQLPCDPPSPASLEELEVLRKAKRSW
jgi:hypothetical protein